VDDGSKVSMLTFSKPLPWWSDFVLVHAFPFYFFG
jgi:hypothetical protein